MAFIVKNIEQASTQGKVNVYAVHYGQRKKEDNIAVALPGNLDWVFRRDFCKNVCDYKNSTEADFNPFSDVLSTNQYESLPLEKVQDKWNEINALLVGAINYHGGENREKVPLSNLFICELVYNGKDYYLCSRQSSNSEKILRGKTVLFSQGDKLAYVSGRDVFLMSSYVGFIIDPSESKVLIFDKKAFQDTFKYDDYLKKEVEEIINSIDEWPFLESTELIKEKKAQKNVYRNLAKVFANEKYLEQIRSVDPKKLKNTLMKRSPDNFKKMDFKGDKLIVSSSNLNTVMNMLAKGFKYNFFADVAEQE